MEASRANKESKYSKQGWNYSTFNKKEVSIDGCSVKSALQHNRTVSLQCLNVSLSLIMSTFSKIL